MCSVSQIRWYDLRYVITTNMACADTFFCPLPVRKPCCAFIAGIYQLLVDMHVEVVMHLDVVICFSHRLCMLIAAAEMRTSLTNTHTKRE